MTKSSKSNKYVYLCGNKKADGNGSMKPLLAAVEEKAKIKAGETTPDGQLSLLTARCIGACGIAPAVVYDGTVTPRQTSETALEHLKGWISNGH